IQYRGLNCEFNIEWHSISSGGKPTFPTCEFPSLEWYPRVDSFFSQLRQWVDGSDPLYFLRSQQSTNFRDWVKTRNWMPRPCAVETHACCYKKDLRTFRDATALGRGVSRLMLSVLALRFSRNREPP